MGTTAARKLNYATIANYDVVAGATVTVGFGVTMATATTVQNAAASSDFIIGIAHTSATSTVAGDANVDVFLFAPVVPVVIATDGTATLGAKATWTDDAAADGFTNAETLTTAGEQGIYGVFVQSGTAGEIVGMQLALGRHTHS
jgi:hypothetical protein